MNSERQREEAIAKCSVEGGQQSGQAAMIARRRFQLVRRQPYDSSSEDELPDRPKRIKKSKDKPRVLNYSDMVGFYNDGEFLAHFRVSREVFNWLLEKLRTTLDQPYEADQVEPAQTRIDVFKQLLSVLWFLATSDSYGSIACRFGMSVRTLYLVFIRVMKTLQCVQPTSWPNIQERRQTRQYFRQLSGIDGVVGVVDSIHVPIIAPREYPHSYFNRRRCHSLILQGICDHRMRFLSAIAGWPGIINAAEIFQRSYIGKDMNEKPDQHFAPHEFLLGDKAYKSKTFLVTPYKCDRNYGEWQREFNEAHRKCRKVMERTTALYFGRFPRLKYLDLDLDKSQFELLRLTIIGGVVLHNVCLTRGGDTLQAQFVKEGAKFVLPLTKDKPLKDKPVAQIPKPPIKYRDAGRLFRDELAREMGLLRDDHVW